MGWWPWSSRSGTSDSKPVKSLELDSDLQAYYDGIIDAGKKQNSGTASQAPVTGVFTTSAHPPQPPTRFGKLKSLNQISMDNCVEYERAYTSCLTQGTYFERFTGCPTRQTMYDKCKEMQRDALTVLGYAQAQTDPERMAIKAQADDLMIKAAPSLSITHDQEGLFQEMLEQSQPPQADSSQVSSA